MEYSVSFRVSFQADTYIHVQTSVSCIWSNLMVITSPDSTGVEPFFRYIYAGCSSCVLFPISQVNSNLQSLNLILAKTEVYSLHFLQVCIALNYLVTICPYSPIFYYFPFSFFTLSGYSLIQFLVRLREYGSISASSISCYNCSSSCSLACSSCILMVSKLKLSPIIRSGLALSFLSSSRPDVFPLLPLFLLSALSFFILAFSFFFALGSTGGILSFTTLPKSLIGSKEESLSCSF